MNVLNAEVFTKITQLIGLFSSSFRILTLNAKKINAIKYLNTKMQSYIRNHTAISYKNVLWTVGVKITSIKMKK